jgi:hypothetical protein
MAGGDVEQAAESVVLGLKEPRGAVERHPMMLGDARLDDGQALDGFVWLLDSPGAAAALPELIQRRFPS